VDCPEGEYKITIRFPAADAERAFIAARWVAANQEWLEKSLTVAEKRELSTRFTSPRHRTVLTLRVQTYPTHLDRLNARCWGYLAGGLVCLVGMLVCATPVCYLLFGALRGPGLSVGGRVGLVVLACPPALLALGLGLGYFGCFGFAEQDLWELHPAAGVAAAMAGNLLVFTLLGPLAQRWKDFLEAWASVLLLLVVLLAGLTVAAWLLPPHFPCVLDARRWFPYAMPAVLPGVALAWLLELRRPYVPLGGSGRSTDSQGGADEEHRPSQPLSCRGNDPC
jgi:hypothetical protein